MGFRKTSETIRSGSIKPGILYLDHREPLQINSFLADNCLLPIEVVALETGDFVVEDICIERKTVNDFAMSLMDKRLKEQRERMLRDFPHRYILVSGTFADCTVNIYRHSLLGALARVMAEGVNVCFGVDSDEDLVYLVIKILENHKKIPPFKPKPKKIEKNINDDDNSFVVGIVE